MDSLLQTDFILYIYMPLVVFCTCIWLLELLQSLLKWIFSQKQVDIAGQDRLRKQNKQNKPDQEKLESSYFLQLEGHEQTLQCFAVRYWTERFIQVDPVQLGSLQGLYVDVEGIQEEREERDGLENVQLHSLTESDIEADEVHQQVSSNDIPPAISIRTGERDDRAQTLRLSELLRIGTVSRHELPFIQMEHTRQSEYRNSSEAESASNYEEDSRGVLDDQVAETEPQNVGPVRPTTQTGCLNNNGALRMQHEPHVHQNTTEDDNNGALRMQYEPQVHQNTTEDDNNGALRMQHEPQVHQNTTEDDNNGALRMQHEPRVHQNTTVDDIPFQPTDAGYTESTVSNFTPYNGASTSLMSMSTSTPSSNFSSISSEDSEAFAYEWIRLRTFSEWPLTSIFSTRLARNGWVSLGEEDRARCYSCHVVHEGWRIGEEPDQYHSPNCRFKDRQSNNVPISTTNSHPTPTLGHVSLLSTQENGSSGNNPEPVQGELQPDLNRPQQDSLSKETTSLSQETEEISSVVNNGNQNRIPNTQPKAPNRNLIRLNYDRPKYQSYAILAARISSFTNRPTAMTQTPQNMALAGFFYTGYKDCTRCFFCGGGLRNWEEGDNPWVEHARFFPHCDFVRQKGPDFISLAQKRSAELEKQQEMVNPQRNTPVKTDTPTLESQANGKSLPSQNFDELTSLKQENTSLKDQILCKICMEKNVSIVFLPCGHLACCKDCAPAMRKCPICRKFVKGTVKTFLV